MKKSLRFGTAIALAATASLTLASCGFGGGGSGGDAEGDGTTLDLLVPSYSDATQGLWEDVISGFEEENPDISVNLEVQSGGRSGAVTAQSSRSQTVREDLTLNQREGVLFSLLDVTMQDVNAQMEKLIPQYLGGFLR